MMPTVAAGIGSELQPVRVRGDERLLAQVFRNLLDKAARHAKSTIKSEWSAVRRSAGLGGQRGEIISPQDCAPCSSGSHG